ncbi:MAG: hypothetical protein NZM11_07655, partial [Anaerolineales bacterium]|nr:hypothetical protein [Anaerolineales bacterium]
MKLWPTRHVALSVATGLFLILVWFYWPFSVDDAYISFTYAKNLVAGRGLTYNGVLVEGYSNFLWTLLSAPFIALGGEPLFWARLVSVVCALLNLWLTEKLIRQLNPGIGTSETLPALASLATWAPFVMWTVGGLETALMSMLVTACVYLELRAPSAAFSWSWATALAAALTRPEGVLLFPLVLGFQTLVTRRFWRHIAISGLLLGGLYGLFLLWRFATYGEWVPNTAFLKLDPGPETAARGGAWLLGFFALRPLLGVIMLLALFALLRDRRRLAPGRLLVMGGLAAFTFFVLYSGPDWMPQHRFLVPALPLLSVVLARALYAFDWKAERWAKVVTQSLVIGSLVLELFFAATGYIPFARHFGRFTEGLVEGGLWIRQNTAPTDVIAVVDAGALAYYSERRAVDILGLNDSHIAR